MSRPFSPATLVCLVALLLCSSCSEQDSLSAIESSGELVVVSRNSPTTYYLEKSGPAGFEYALTGLLAKELGVKLVMKPAFTLRDLFTQLSREEVDLAAAGLTLTAARASLFPHSTPYETIVTQVVYVAGTRRPRSMEDLVGRSIVTLAGSSHAEALAALKETTLADLSWREIPVAETMELLDMVNAGEADLALIDSSEFLVQQSLFPRLKVAFDLSSEQEVVWYLPPGRNNARLLSRIDDLITKARNNGTLERLREVHFGHTEGISRISSHTFTRQMRTVLPRYRHLIRQVASEYQLDWRLLAAVAYQESHWNPIAESPTGVRGMMMLTLPTAMEMGVDNRLDAAQSMRGGARYLKNMMRRLATDIPEPDRTWMALAAYNIGLGHLEDARVLTERQGGDPHLWREVEARLPLLQNSSYYPALRYGYARGREAVTYVQNIRHYRAILQWQDIPENNVKPPLQAKDYLPDALGKLQLLAL